MNRLNLTDTAGRTFPSILRRQAEENGDTVFLVNDYQSITFAEADELTDRLAGGLRALGVRAGDRIALYLGNCPEFVLVTLAANKLGAIWVPISTDYRGEWLHDTLERSRCRVLVADPERAARLEELEDFKRYGTPVCVDEGNAPGWLRYVDLLRSVPIAEPVKHEYGDTCAILWTSGTTGRSKGVMQNYNGWIRAIDQGASLMFDSEEGDIIYCALPLFNTGAWITSVYRALIEGIPCVIEARFSAREFWSRIAKFRATQTFLIGAMSVFLWEQPKSRDDAKTTLSKAMIVPCPPDLRDPFEQRFRLKILTSGLGMSECQLIANQLGSRGKLPPHSLGYPPPDIDLRLCNDYGYEVPDGEPGEICIRPLAPHVLFNGYFDNPEATAMAFRDDFFLTGDMARRDPDTGALYFVDRKKDVVRFAGRNISSLEVEGVVRNHPLVQDVAAYGIPSAEVESEDELKIDVVLKSGEELPPEQLCDYIAESAPHYFVPRYLEYMFKLPYTPTNKVQKFKLRERGVTPTTWDRIEAGYQVKR
ncbi:MAG: AMP-binding protein [Halieaceae bacterium]|nr:AMP-binding protein [Halieaceae bacterium]